MTALSWSPTPWERSSINAVINHQCATACPSDDERWAVLERLRPPEPRHAPQRAYDVPGTDLTTPAALAELARRRPHADAVATVIHRMMWNRREDPRYHSYLTFRYDAYDDKPGWRPAVDLVLSVDDVRDMLLGLQVGDGVSRGIGVYHLGVDDRDDRIVIDLDAKSEAQRATIEARLRRLEEALRRVGVPYLLARSRGGKGYHVTVFFAERHLGSALRAFGRLLLGQAGLVDDVKSGVELFPKQDTLGAPGEKRSGHGKVGGLQTALPGDLTAWLARGGSVLLDTDHDPVPFDRWADHLEYLDENRLTTDRVRLIGSTAGVDPFAAPARRAPSAVTYASDVRGLPPITSVDALESFLGAAGVAVRMRRSATAAWTHRLILQVCPNSEAHSDPTDNRDAAVLLDDRTGVCRFSCPHAGCKDFWWPHLVRKLGYEVDRREVPAVTSSPALAIPRAPLADLQVAVDIVSPVRILDRALQSADPWADMPPPPLPPRDEDVGDITARALEELEPTVAAADPRALRRRLGDPERALLNQVATEQPEHGAPERGRALRVADCGRAQQVKWCDAHQVVHACPLMCGRAGACVTCAGVTAAARREYVATHWPESGWVRVDVGRSVALSDPATAYAAMKRGLACLKAIVRKRRIRGRQWFIGAHTALLATLDPVDAVYVSDALKRMGVAHELLGTLSPMASADLVYDVTVEPAHVLEDLLGSAEGAAVVSDFPYLTESHVRRTDRGRVGAQLPWASEDELRAEKKERAREAAVARGEDPDAFDHATCPRAVAKPDGTVTRCGRALQARVVLDGVEVARGRHGAPAWAANDRAFAVMAAERVHRRETSHLPST